MKLLFGCLFTLVIVVILFALYPIIRIGQFVRQVRHGARQQSDKQTQVGRRNAKRKDTARQKRKIYANGEGEYVDFEEISGDEAAK